MTKQPRRPIPIRPFYGPQESFIQRAAFAAVKSLQSSRVGDSVATCRQLWPDDVVSPMLLTRASVEGAKTSTSGWASELADTALLSFLASLAPMSAASQLIALGLGVTFDPGTMEIKWPMRNGAPAAMPWIAEGDPIPLRANSLATVTIGPPKKFGVIVGFTRDLARRSSAAATFEVMLREEASLSLDAAYFSATAASGAAHAGLLNGLTAISSYGGDDRDAMLQDLAALAKAVSAGGSGQFVFIMGPGRASAISILAPDLKATILASIAVAEDRVIAVDPLSLLHLVDTSPDLAASQEAALHYADDPAAIGTAGSPPTVAAPTRSLFQTDCIAFRMLAELAFGSRRAGAVAFVDGVGW